MFENSFQRENYTIAKGSLSCQPSKKIEWTDEPECNLQHNYRNGFQKPKTTSNDNIVFNRYLSSVSSPFVWYMTIPVWFGLNHIMRGIYIV